MPSQLDTTGLQIATITEIINNLIAGYQLIYGSDINVDSNSPDGQKINLHSQAIIDQLELLMSVYNSFNPLAVNGVIQDTRYAINGLERIQGTYTYTPVSITVDRALNLIGLDTDPTGATVFIVSDGSNQFYLETSQIIAVAGTASYTFRAVNLGAITTTINTITTIITPQLGVISVNNPSITSINGIDEETDLAFKMRRLQSFALQAQSPADAVKAELLRTPDVTDAYVLENDTVSPIGSVPAHSLWCIVEGGAAEDIANAIYIKRSSGCSLYGSVPQLITRIAGNNITIKFDRPINEDLYIHFYLSPKIAGTTFDEDYIKETLAEQLIYTIAESANTNAIIALLNTIEPNAYITGCEISNNGTAWEEILDTTDIQHKFLASSAKITVLT